MAETRLSVYVYHQNLMDYSLGHTTSLQKSSKSVNFYSTIIFQRHIANRDTKHTLFITHIILSTIIIIY